MEELKTINYRPQHPKQQPHNTPLITSKQVYIESYGCQMNFSDSEIVASILSNQGFSPTKNMESADLILLNTCSIREKAEQTITHRLTQINHLKKHNPTLLVGILGCMAERLKKKLLDDNQIVDLVVGPDAYRDLPKLVEDISEGGRAINTLLSREETYADIAPLRLNSNGVTAFLSIMRGCDNMCSFCVVPFTRGRERSRDPQSLINEATNLFEQGYREITLLGQNVDSYRWSPEENNKARLAKLENQHDTIFAELLEFMAQINPALRIRFSTSHPRDITDEVLYVMATYKNVCNHIHLPLQSGNDRILNLMNRGYTRAWYVEKIARIREILGPDAGISSDIIAGFCTETEAEHQDTLSMMELVCYDFSYMFCYSERPNTPAAKKLEDSVPLATKKRRLAEIIETQRKLSLQRNQHAIGKVFNVLIEGHSKRSETHLQGRNFANTMIVFPKRNEGKGDYVKVLVEKCTSATLLGTIID